jgi:hypothetical protein
VTVVVGSVRFANPGAAGAGAGAARWRLCDLVQPQKRVVTMMIMLVIVSTTYDRMPTPCSPKYRFDREQKQRQS